MSNSENIRDRLTMSPKRVGSVFLGDLQRHRFPSPLSSPSSTPTSSPKKSVFHHSHGHHLIAPRRSSLDDNIDIGIDIDMDSAPSFPVAPSVEKTKPSSSLLDDGSSKPGKIDPVVAMELRLRWLEVLILGIKQDLSKDRKGKVKDAAYASFGDAQMIASANLKSGETLMRLAQSVQQRLNKALEGNEGLKRFMDNYDQHAHLLTSSFALSGILPDPPTYDKMTTEEMNAFLAEMEPDIRAADRDLLEIDALEKKGVLGSGKLHDQETLQPRLQALIGAYKEDVKLVTSLEARIAYLVQRHGTYIDTLSELFVAWDDTITEAEERISRMEREKSEKTRLGLT